MKTIIYFLFAMTLIIGCRKTPEGVQLTVDKSSIKLGEKATLTATVDGKVSWVALFKKTPNASAFTETQGGRPAPNYTVTFDTDTTSTTGVYTFYVEARNCKSNPDKKCKSIKSNEVSVTVTP